MKLCYLLMDGARWPFVPEDESVSVFTLCQREEERFCFSFMDKPPSAEQGEEEGCECSGPVMDTRDSPTTQWVLSTVL